MHRISAPALRSRSRTSRLLLRIVLIASWTGCVCLSSTIPGSNEKPRLPKALEPLIPSYPQETLTALGSLKHGVEDYLAGRYSSAAAALSGSGRDATALGDYFLLYRAKVNLMLDSGEEALRDFRLLQSRYPSSSQSQEATLGECQALLKLHKFDEAISLVQSNSKLQQNAEALYYQARALEEAGKRDEAVALYLRVFTGYVNSGIASQAQQRLLGLSPQAMIDRKNQKALLLRAENLLRAERNREARTLLLKLAGIPAVDKAASQKRELFLGEAEFELGRVPIAIGHLKQVSDPAIQPEGIYYLASCYRKLKREDSFLSMRAKALALYPRSSFTEKVLYSVATYYDVNDRPKEANDSYRAIVENFPEGTHAERALWKTALYSYVEKDYGTALQGFWKYLFSYSDTSSAAAPLYWMGRCYAKLGDTANAGRTYSRVAALANHSYYGQRAHEAESILDKSGIGQMYAGLDFNQVIQKLDNISYRTLALSEPSEAVGEIIERVRQLVASDLTDLALAELRWAIRRYPKESSLGYMMAGVCGIKQDYYGAFVALRRIFPDYSDRPTESLPEEVWGLFFPVRYSGIVASQADKYKINPDLILGLIRQESAFNESARSSSNARGLMQVLPATGRTLARQAGVRRFTANSLYRADTNIALGTRHLASLLEQFGNKEELALAAYNAGDSRVDQWVQSFGSVDMAEFVERIPFSETRGYVKQVLTNKALYGILKASVH